MRLLGLLYLPVRSSPTRRANALYRGSALRSSMTPDIHSSRGSADVPVPAIRPADLSALQLGNEMESGFGGLLSLILRFRSEVLGALTPRVCQRVSYAAVLGDVGNPCIEAKIGAAF